MSDGTFNFQYGISAEQACVLCHLSAECEGCCLRCKNDKGCYGQTCSQPDRDTQGARWDAWMYMVATYRPDLRRYIPRKWRGEVNKLIKAQRAAAVRVKSDFDGNDNGNDKT